MNRFGLCVAVVISMSVWAAASEAGPTYELNAGWCKAPAGRQTIGNSHGEVRVDKAGNVYVSIDDKSEAGRIQVFGPDGKYLKSIGVPGVHGFVLREEDGIEYLYAAHLWGKQVLKMKLDGTVVLTITEDKFPGGAKGLTGLDVAPNGDIYTVNGYGNDMIHRFDKTGKHLSSFGGKKPPFSLANCHKIFVDPRYDEPRLLLCDRAHLRLVHATLEGEVIHTYAHDLKRPSSAAFWGDWVAIAEIAGRVTVLDKEGKVVVQLGENNTRGQTNTNRVEPKDWQPGVFTSPHGIGFDAKGNLYVTEWNKFGRVIRYDLKSK